MITQTEGLVSGREQARRELQPTIDRLTDWQRQARHWLVEHGQHPPACDVNKGRDCDCGLDDLRRTP